ncbi:ATP synthase subunit alpha [bacterium HR39]|nr:ATP synthase subunit alpha [bacterium HR39]
MGEGLLGRVVDPLGRPLDGGGAIEAAAHWPVERPAPPIVARDFVERPLHTGLLVVDAMLPIGRGQRELILGDRKTGKTSLAVDAIVAQKQSDVICIYAAIGQKTTTVKQVVEAIRRYGPMERTVFVVGEAETLPGLQWLVPYAACTVGEWFRDHGRDVLVVYDDLTRHADVHRELALLLRLPAGREAFPGDVFYLHSRLLERAARLAPEAGGGSLSALPIAETAAGNIAAYIPTNLISITDGQIYLEPRLFHAGQKPAVDVGLSVSRVGGRAQPPVLRRLAARLRLEYARFLEVEQFARFGGITDPHTLAVLRRGRRIRFLLSQPRHRPYTLDEEVVLLLALDEGRLDPVPEEHLPEARTRLLEAVAPRARELAPSLGEGRLDDAGYRALLAAVDEALRGLAEGAGGAGS